MKNKLRYSQILLWQFVKTDFAIKYQGSALGYVWSLLRPLAMFLILYTVFGVFMKMNSNINFFPVYLLLGIVLWNFFADVTVGSVQAIASRGDLIRKINFPKDTIISAITLSAFINFVISLLVISVFIVIGKVPLSLNSLLFIPLIIELFLFSIGVGFLLSTLFIRFRDMSYVWDVVLQAAFYATPVLYVVGIIPHKIAKIVMLNPMAQIIQDSRYVLVTKQTGTISSIYSNQTTRYLVILLVIIIFLSGILYFKKREPFFAEEA